MRKVVLVFWLLLTSLLTAWSEPVQIQREFDGRKLTLNGEWIVPQGVDPSQKGVVLWLHGLMQTHNMQEPIAVQRNAWVEAGFPVLSPTLSLGTDNRKEPYDCSYPLDHEYEQDLLEIQAWIEWLRSKGVKKIILAGHSFGGQQVIHAYGKLKGKGVVGLLAVAPSKGLKREHPHLRRAEKLLKAGKGKELLKTSFFYCRSAPVSARTLYSHYGVDRHIGRYLKDIDVPVLIVWGGEDSRVKDLPRFLEPFLGKNARLEVIDYADHFFRDLASEDLSSIAIEFFNEVLK